MDIKYFTSEQTQILNNGWLESNLVAYPAEIAATVGTDDRPIGAVLIDSMGSDRHVAMAAWASTDKWERAFTCPEDIILRLLRSLVKNRHASPFGHPHVMLFIVAPLVIWTQILRHRSFASFSLLSLRYTWSMLKMYFPATMRRQVGSSMSYEYEPIPGWRNWLGLWVLRLGYGLAILCYLWLQRLGVAKEVARFLLPGGTITRGFATVSLRNALNFLVLRDDVHAQEEVRTIARDLHAILFDLYPMTMSLWEEHGRPQL